MPWSRVPAPWLRVAADDRTGALETAGLCADAGAGAVLVSTRTTESADEAHIGAQVRVTDLASRHLAPHAAHEVAAAHERATRDDPPGRVAHKIDSTLRGNWAAELAARAGAGRRVLVVPAFPALGRTCRDGVVLVDGRPVAESAAGGDVRTPVAASRPVDHLVDAGLDASAVALLRGAADVAAWSAGSGRVAVCDAASDHELAAVAERWAEHREILLAGPAGAIGAGVAAALTADGRAPVRTEAPRVAAPVLVVCGSLHAAARTQVDRLLALGAADVVAGRGAPDVRSSGASVVVVRTETIDGAVDAAAAVAAAKALAACVRDLLASWRPAVLVVLGGDTAEAVLGRAPRWVGGTVAPGTPWCVPRGDEPIVITRAGGFGGPTALVDLVHRALTRGRGPVGGIG